MVDVHDATCPPNDRLYGRPDTRQVAAVYDEGQVKRGRIGGLLNQVRAGQEC